MLHCNSKKRCQVNIFVETFSYDCCWSENKLQIYYRYVYKTKFYKTSISLYHQARQSLNMKYKMIPSSLIFFASYILGAFPIKGISDSEYQNNTIGRLLMYKNLKTKIKLIKDECGDLCDMSTSTKKTSIKRY